MCEVKQQEDGFIFITQEQYAKKVLEKFHMHESKPVGIPSVSVQDPENSVTKERVGDDVPYRAVIGSLMYLATGTRPDISYAVSTVSQELNNPSVEAHRSSY